MKKSLAHTVWECKYHIVWVPKNRRKIAYGRLQREIGKVLRKLCEYKGIEVLDGAACADHIHIFLSIPPKYAVSTIVGRSRYAAGKKSKIVYNSYTCPISGTFKKGVYHESNRSKSI